MGNGSKAARHCRIAQPGRGNRRERRCDCGWIKIGGAAAARADDPAISAERIRADVKFLSSDRLEGRGIGTLGEERTIDFIAAEFAKAGLKPAGDRGTFFQGVPLVKVLTGAKATLAATKGGETIDFELGEEFVGQNRTQQPLEEFDVETIFLFPWAVYFHRLGWFGLIEMVVFLVILVVGYFYVWRRGALDWA